MKVKVKVKKNLEKTVQNGGSLNLAMISLPYREKLLLSLTSNKLHENHTVALLSNVLITVVWYIFQGT